MNNQSIATALKLHQAGNVTEAREIYIQVLASDPNNIYVLHLLGILSAQENDFRAAAQYLEKALNLEPNSPMLHNSMGNILKGCGEFSSALQHLQIALQQQPKNAVLHNNIAIIQQKLNNHKSAIKHYQHAIELQPNYADAHYNLSLAMLNGKEPNESEAIIQLKITLELQPQHPSALCQLAQIYQRQQQNDNALTLYQKSLKLDKNNIIAQQNLGALLLAKNKFAAAIRHFKKVLNIEPLNQDAFYNLGAAFLRQKNPEAALKYFLRLSQLSKDFNVFYNLGVIYNDINRTNDAITYFTEALKINANDFATHINLGAIYLKIENYEKVLEHYTKAAQIQPQNKEVIYTLAAIKQNQTQTTAPQEYIQNLFDNYATNYDKHLELLDYQAPQLIYEAIRTTINPQLKSWNIFDLGCGTGLCGEKLHNLAHKLIGVDVSEEMLKIAAQKNIYAELQQDTIENALANQNDLDLIIAADTFPYIGDLTNIFSLTKKSLKKQSYFAFTVEKLANKLDLNNESEKKSDCTDYILQRTLRFSHSEKYIIKLAENNSFKIILQSSISIRKHHNTMIESFLFILQS